MGCMSICVYVARGGDVGLSILPPVVPLKGWFFTSTDRLGEVGVEPRVGSPTFWMGEQGDVLHFHRPLHNWGAGKEKYMRTQRL